MVKNPKKDLSLKKAGLFILLILIGISIFGAISIFTLYSWSLLSIFFILYIITTMLILKEYSKNKLIFLIIIVFVYLLIMTFPFNSCSFNKYGTSQICTCAGIEKHVFNLYAGFDDSQCIGTITKYGCYNYNGDYTYNLTYQSTPC